MADGPSVRRRLLALAVTPLLLLLGDAIADTGVRLSLKPLDLTRPPTTSELMAAGQLGGPLHPTRDADDTPRERRIRLDFGRAIQTWNEHDYRRAVELFRRHIETYPDSPWAAEAELHIGCDAQYQGRYREARTTYQQLMARWREAPHPGARMMAHKARLRLAGLEVLQYDFAAAREQFRILKAESPDWRHRTYAAHWIRRLSLYRSHEQAMLTCGTQALATVLEARGQAAVARDVRAEIPGPSRGQSMENLVARARERGLPARAQWLTASDLASVPLPAIVHLVGSPATMAGHYWVLEGVGSGTVRLFDPQSGRRFEQSFAEFSKEWDGSAIVLSERADLPGTAMNPREAREQVGGCCGAPARESDLGDPDGDNDPDDCGAPVWTVNMISMNFYLSDTPLWYTPPYGPPVRIRLSYNSQSAIAYHEPFGPKWQFNYASYMVIDTGGSVTLFRPDGRRDIYTPDGMGGFVPPTGVHDELAVTGPERYELRLLDGTVWVYSMPRPAGGGVVTQLFLEAIRNTRGKALSFAYDTEGRLVSITDAVEHVFTLSYDGESRVVQVADPFGRTAGFEYDAEGNLSRITDMGGYSSTFTYDADRYLTGVDGARGRWEFLTEPSDGIVAWSDEYPPPGEEMWENYRITVTNPLGDRSEYFYYGGCEEGYGCAGYSWYVSPRHYIPFRSIKYNTFHSQPYKTRYLPTVLAGGLGAIAEVRTPEGRSTRYTYDDDGNVIDIEDGAGHGSSYTYGARGQVLTATDPVGAITTYTYAPNDVDVLTITDGLGTTTYTYNAARELTSITDRLGRTTSATYNALGQLATLTDPSGVTTTFTYASGAEPARGTREGQTIFTRTYDARGRAMSHTDATGLTLTIGRDDLNRVTSVLFPDGLGRSFTYAGCCLGQTLTRSDRSGGVTSFVYDALSRRTEIHAPDRSVTRLGHDRDGNLSSRTDPAGKVTRFEYDHDGLLIRRIFADGTSESFTHDHRGSVTSWTNVRGQKNSYTYDARRLLTAIAFGDGALPVTYGYDAYGRRTQRIDATGTTLYTYDAESELTGIDGPLSNDAVAMEYDAVGRMSRVAVEGGSPTAYSYDRHGRLQTVTQAGETFSFEHIGTSPFASAINRSSGVRTTLRYDGLNRLDAIEHRRSDLSLIASVSYAFDASGRRIAESWTGALPPPGATARQTRSTYDAADALLATADPTQAYSRDADGNMTVGRAPAGESFTASYDSENRITSLEYTDAGGIVRRNEYAYDGDGWLVHIRERNDGVVARERRFVRGPRLFLQERDASNAVTAELVWDLTKEGGIGGLLKQRIGGLDYAYLQDASGNVTAVVDPAESVVAAYRYDPFGGVSAAAGTLAQDFRFQAKLLDPRSGLSYFGFRWQAPREGRWLTRDPLREGGGTNLFAYAAGDPLNRNDPWGLAVESPGSVFVSVPSNYGPGEWGVYDEGGGVCYASRGHRVIRNPVKTFFGRLWAALEGFLGTDSSPEDDESNAVVGVRG